MAAIKKLHDSGFVHHDLRSENILRAHDGSARLIDLVTVKAHRCARPKKKKGDPLRKALGHQCAELLAAAKILALD
jgi:serine/threonine protein kinase